MDESTYQDHVRRSDMEYLLSFEEWEKTLSDADRARLRDCAAPDLDSHSRSPTGREKDVAESGIASEWPDMELAVDRPQDQLMEMFDLTPGQAEGLVQFFQVAIDRRAQFEKARVIVKVAGAFLNAPNVKLYAAALAYASDLALTCGMGSMRAWSASNGVTPAAVSKVAKFWRRELNLPQGHHMRSEELSETYRASQTNPEKGGHWRNRKFKSADTQKPNP
jgi:hypothetical protein